MSQTDLPGIWGETIRHFRTGEVPPGWTVYEPLNAEWVLAVKDAPPPPSLGDVWHRERWGR